VGTIVVCADGTWNRPEEDLAKDHPTNVLKLARAVKPVAAGKSQRVFYDWGLGSYHSRVLAGGTGRGIHKNILDGYRYIVQNYSAGDRIYLFGFSRGAYTVRALSGLINNCGIVKRPDARLIERAFSMYKSPSAKNHPEGDAATRFRREHSHRSRSVAFVGVWDTVGALGIPFSLMGLLDSNDEFYDTKLGHNVKIARHALAIDEQREDFEPTLWLPRAGIDIKQVWFAGVHSDIGGSYGPDRDSGAEVSDTALAWMLDEAESAGLAIEPHIRERLTDGVLAPVHRSRRHVYRLKKPLHRPLAVPDIPTLIHPSVRRRWLSDAGYRPRRLRELLAPGGWDPLPVGC
jgi:uncharacterized protein (DUF2235 family)